MQAPLLDNFVKESFDKEKLKEPEAVANALHRLQERIGETSYNSRTSRRLQAVYFEKFVIDPAKPQTLQHNLGRIPYWSIVDVDGAPYNIYRVSSDEKSLTLNTTGGAITVTVEVF
jgi:hypothetical protein